MYTGYLMEIKLSGLIFLGVCQSDSLLPSLYSIFINDMAKDVKYMKIGVDIGNLKIIFAIYADDKE